MEKIDSSSVISAILPLCKLGGRQNVEKSDLRIATAASFTVVESVGGVNGEKRKQYFSVLCSQTEWVLEPEVFVSTNFWESDGRYRSFVDLNPGEKAKVEAVTVGGVERKKMIPAVDFGVLSKGFASGGDSVDFFTVTRGVEVEKAIWETSRDRFFTTVNNFNNFREGENVERRVWD